LEDITKAISALVSGTEQWADVAARLPKFEGQEVE
jgi:glycyl-tRNA synthetase